MPYEFRFPDVGEGIHEGIVQKWFVKEGDKVKADQPLGEIETDKAVVEMPSPKTGTIYKLHVKEGETIKVGEVMITILLEGESPDKIESKSESKNQKEISYTGSVVGFLEEAKEVQSIQTFNKAVSSQSKPNIQATPAVRNLAKRLKVDLSTIAGTNPGSPITLKDVQSAAGHTAAKYEGEIERIKISSIRKIAAERMVESFYTAPQVTNMNEADATELFKLRESEKPKYEKEGIKLTFMPYIIKAVQIALQKNPYLNSSIDGDEIIIKKYYNIGIAAETEDGLMVPVIKKIEEKDIRKIAVEMDKLTNEARERKINLMDLRGSSFSITNLGALGAEFFTPILNYPEVGILGVGKISDKPIVKNGKIEIRKILPMSLTYDHRAVDGAHAARFINDLIKLLENPREIEVCD